MASTARAISKRRTRRLLSSNTRFTRVAMTRFRPNLKGSDPFRLRSRGMCRFGAGCLKGSDPFRLGWVRSVVAIAVAVPWVVWALLRTLGVELPFPLVALVAFTPYAALSSPLPVVIALALRQWRVAVLAGVAAGLLGVAMVPRAVAGPRPDADGPVLVVMTSNVWLGSADVDALLAVAREHDVDVLSLQEVRTKTIRRLERAGAAEQFPAVRSSSRLQAPAAAACSPAYRCASSMPDVPGAQQPEVVVTVPERRPYGSRRSIRAHPSAAPPSPSGGRPRAVARLGLPRRGPDPGG